MEAEIQMNSASIYVIGPSWTQVPNTMQQIMKSSNANLSTFPRACRVFLFGPAPCVSLFQRTS